MLFHHIFMLAMPAAASVTRQTWKFLAPIPYAPRQEHSAVALSDKTIAIIGGIVPNNATGTGFNTTNWIQLYDIVTDSWSEPRHAPAPVNHPNVAAVNGEIFLLGGLAVSPDGAWRAIPQSWKYNPNTDQWTSLEPIPAGRESGSAAVGTYGDLIFLAGGMRTLEPLGRAGEQDTVDYISAFDTKLGSWIDLPHAATFLPEGRDHAAVSVVNGKLYVLGGRLRGQVNVKDTVFSLDLENLGAGWVIEEGRMPTPRGGVVGGAVGRHMYVFGGEGNLAEGSDGIFDNVEAYDIKTDMWQRLDPMTLPRHGGSAVTIGQSIYLPGGGIREGGSPVHAFDVFIAPK